MRRLLLLAALLLGALGGAADNAPGAPGWRVPLGEAGQSGVCVSGEKLFLTVHRKLAGPSKGGFLLSGDIVGQCFDKRSGKLLWEADLPGTHAGIVLESWHDATSLLPVSDGERVVFHNLNGMLACFRHDGEPLWKRAWQAPDPDIKNCRMFLSDGAVIVSLPSDRVAVPASKQHPALPYYQLRSIELATGHDRWVSPVLLNHATQYSLDVWRGAPVIVASIADLSHWKFGQGSKGYLISPKDGAALRSFDLPPDFIPHQKNQLCQGRFVCVLKDKSRTHFQLIDPESGAVAGDFAFEVPDTFFGWSGLRHEPTAYRPRATAGILKGDGFPTPSTVHVVGRHLYFWRYDSPDIGCVDSVTGQSTLIQAPLQVLADRIVWSPSEFSFTKGIRNSGNLNVNNRVGSVRGITMGGFGHTNPAWPVLAGDLLYWQNGAGVLYVIDTRKPFLPEALTWKATDPVGQSWTFGEPAIDDAYLYIRSQRDLLKIPR